MPEDKLEYVKALQKEGKSADDRRRHQRRARFGSGRRIRRRSGRDGYCEDGADIVLLNEDLRTVAHLLDQARRTRYIIRQNLIWAGAYNIIAHSACCVLGYVLPWIAALGMSFSSLAVHWVNALGGFSSFRWTAAV